MDSIPSFTETTTYSVLSRKDIFVLEMAKVLVGKMLAKDVALVSVQVAEELLDRIGDENG